MPSLKMLEYSDSCVQCFQDDVFAEPNLLTKTPGKVSSNSECQLNMGPLTTPTKGKGSLSCEPWTPTSNLKMLISAASPEIRNRERELCKEGTEGGDLENVTVVRQNYRFTTMNMQFMLMYMSIIRSFYILHLLVYVPTNVPELLKTEQEPGQGEESEKLQISRKEKSLGLLCQKFLARYPDYPNPAVNNDICLDDVAGELSRLQFLLLSANKSIMYRRFVM